MFHISRKTQQCLKTIQPSNFQVAPFQQPVYFGRSKQHYYYSATHKLTTYPEVFLSADFISQHSSAQQEVTKTPTTLRDWINLGKEKAKHLVQEGIHMVVHGSKSFYSDLSFLKNLSSKSKSAYTVEEIVEKKRVVRDISKFIPFYLFVIIPLAEVALPFYLMLFPRAIPTCFMPESQIKEETYKYMENQAKAAKVLKAKLVQACVHCGYIPQEQTLRTFFLANKDKVMSHLELKKMNSEMLKYMCDFLAFEYIEGTYILNTLYKHLVNSPRYVFNTFLWLFRQNYRIVWINPIFNYKFKFNSYPFEAVKKALLKAQLSRQIAYMNQVNQAILDDKLGKISKDKVLKLARERGFITREASRAKAWLNNKWRRTVEDNQEDEMSLFWLAVLNYTKSS